jgi:hypothetical protein
MKSFYVIVLSTLLLFSGSFAEGKPVNSKYINEEYKFSIKPPAFTIVNAKRKLSLRGAKRRGNLVRLLHFVRNDIMVMSTYL